MISIITACLNNAATIEETILSVITQHEPVDYLIIDGGSTDGTLDIIRKYRRYFSTVVSEKDRGIYDAINKGIRQARGNVVGMLHADDRYANDEVISHIAEAFASEQTDALYSDLLYITRDDKVFRHWKAGAYKSTLFRKGWMPPHPTFFARRALYERLGLYNTSLRLSADYELMLRFIHRHGIRVHYLPEITVHMRVGGKSNFSLLNRLIANREDVKAWRINGISPPLLLPLIKPLRKIWQFV